MKTLKTTLSVFALLGIFATSAIAQETGNVAVTATVVADLTVSADQDIALGTIQAATSTIAAGPDDGTSEVNLGTGATYGIVRITGEATTSIDVTFGNATLDTSPASDLIDFTASVFDSASDASVASGGDLTTNGTGNITLYIGGTLDAPAGSGSYSTANTSDPVDITITYN